MRIFGAKEYRQKITGLSKNISLTLLDRLIRKGSSQLAEDVRKRIFEEGKTINDSLISPSYSKNPMYVSKKDFVKKGAFKNIGKNGKRTKNSMYLKQGYHQLRSIQGMDTSKVVLKYTGRLQKNYNPIGVAISLDRSAGPGGKTNTLNAKVKIGFRTKLDALKAEGLEKKYGKQDKIFRPSKKEMRELVDFLRNQ